jgi:hypothetical protein
MDGSIDEVRLYSRALTESEIYELYSLKEGNTYTTTIPVTNVSSYTKIPVWFAGDKLGENYQLTYGESAYANYETDSNTVGYWKMNSNKYEDETGQHTVRQYYGIDYGIRSSNLNIIANQWNGVANNGEMDITCSGGDSACYIITMDGSKLSTPSIGYGFAMIENAAISAFAMYSPSLSGQGITPFSGGGDNYIGVRYSGGVWQYDNNTSWVTFTPKDYNILVASFTTGNPSISNVVKLENNPIPTEGRFENAMSFDGVNDYIKVPASSDFDLQNLTIDAWVYSENFQDSMFIFEKTTNGTVNTQYSAFFEVTDNFYFRTINSSSTWDTLSFKTSEYVKNGAWSHIVCTYDGSTKAIYVNGQLVASSAYSQTLMTNPAGTAIIGAYGSGSNYFFDGKIDELRVSSVGRTATEVRQTYEVGRRTHTVNVEFKADLQSGNLISSSSDKSFTISETGYGTTEDIENLAVGDTIIVTENSEGTEYKAQGVVDTVNTGTGAVTVSSWKSGSTFPTGGYTANATVFKWQRVDIDLGATTDKDADTDAVTKLTIRKLTASGSNLYIDDIRAGEDFAYTEDVQYFQYRTIFTTWDGNITPYISTVQVDYSASAEKPTMDQVMRHGKWFNSTGEKQNFWWATGDDV